MQKAYKTNSKAAQATNIFGRTEALIYLQTTLLVPPIPMRRLISVSD